MTKKTRTITATLSDCHFAPLDKIGCCMKCGEECGYKDIKFDVEEYKQHTSFDAFIDWLLIIAPFVIYFLLGVACGIAFGSTL